MMGVIMAPIKDMTGRRFGRLLVTGFDSIRPPAGRAYWKVRCDCGNETVSDGVELRQGKIVSCGCKRRESYIFGNEARTTHGHASKKRNGGPQTSRTYTSWVAMIRRC